jgi:hypothetical protein
MAERPPEPNTIRVEIAGLKELTQAIGELKTKPEPRRSRINLGIFFTVLIAMSGYFMTWYIGYLNVKKDQIRDEIKDKITSYETVMDSISDLRYVTQKAVKQCKINGNTNNKIKELNLERYLARMDIVKTSFKGRFLLRLHC